MDHSNNTSKHKENEQTRKTIEQVLEKIQTQDEVFTFGFTFMAKILFKHAMTTDLDAAMGHKTEKIIGSYSVWCASPRVELS
ncbi:CLUMA_CG001839, isoform A [Clunio marinus]|uniref:CLUMA_CG001839, isoform A n=1 Tax=Clunio marinus TaxID=568069 RepID=A0A1J1HNL0_9DIPT|nr:CLUMA_CG001839, isoform A [Clunio marinus]